MAELTKAPLRVSVVSADQELWSGEAKQVVAKTLIGELGILRGHEPVLAILAPLLALLFKWVIDERVGVIIASAFALHTAWHWLTDRAAALTAYDWSMSDPATLARLLRVLMVLVAAAGGAWVIRAFRKR